jgi:uncharacterized membrane protein HdeD (DUF308 family)
MNLPSERNQENPLLEEALHLRRIWLWFVILGIVIIMVGLAAIGSAFITTLATITIFGVLLLTGGIVQIVNAFLARNWRAFFLFMLVGLLQFILGGMMIKDPQEIAAGITFLLAAGFIVAGAARLIYATLHSFSGRRWVLLNGLITLLLGISIWRRWPESKDYVIGLFIGIELVFAGWSWAMLGLTVRTMTPVTEMKEAQPTSTTK